MAVYVLVLGFGRYHLLMAVRVQISAILKPGSCMRTYLLALNGGHQPTFRLRSYVNSLQLLLYIYTHRARSKVLAFLLGLARSSEGEQIDIILASVFVGTSFQCSSMIRYHLSAHACV